MSERTDGAIQEGLSLECTVVGEIERKKDSVCVVHGHQASDHRPSLPPDLHQPAQSDPSSRRCAGRLTFPGTGQLFGADLIALAL